MRPEDYRIELVGGDEALAERCGRVLDGFAAVAVLPPARLLDARRPPDMILLVMEGRSLPRVRLLAECRALWPATPVVVLATHVDLAFAVELLKCGADDLLALPPDPEALRGKVLRALLGRPGPAVGWPVLEPLTPRARPCATGANLRHCYRAVVPGHLGATAVTVLGDDGRASLDVRDLSVEVGEWPAGMLLEASGAIAERLPVEDWIGGVPVPMLLQLGQEAGPIPVLAHMRGPLRPAAAHARRVGMQFFVKQPADRARLQRFWMRCQRQVRR